MDPLKDLDDMCSKAMGRATSPPVSLSRDDSPELDLYDRLRDLSPADWVANCGDYLLPDTDAQALSLLVKLQSCAASKRAGLDNMFDLAAGLLVDDLLDNFDRVTQEQQQ